MHHTPKENFKESPKLHVVVLWLASRSSLDKEFHSLGPSTESSAGIRRYDE